MNLLLNNKIKNIVFAKANLRFCPQISASLLKGCLRYRPDKHEKENKTNGMKTV